MASLPKIEGLSKPTMTLERSLSLQLARLGINQKLPKFVRARNRIETVLTVQNAMGAMHLCMGECIGAKGLRENLLTLEGAPVIASAVTPSRAALITRDDQGQLKGFKYRVARRSRWIVTENDRGAALNVVGATMKLVPISLSSNKTHAVNRNGTRPNNGRRQDPVVSPHNYVGPSPILGLEAVLRRRSQS